MNQGPLVGGGGAALDVNVLYVAMYMLYVAIQCCSIQCCFAYFIVIAKINVLDSKNSWLLGDNILLQQYAHALHHRMHLESIVGIPYLEVLYESEYLKNATLWGEFEAWYE